MSFKGIELIVLISLAPTIDYLGITQEMSHILGIDIDPWNSYEGDRISEEMLSKIEYKPTFVAPCSYAISL